jgi:hypothetical protein
METDSIIYIYFERDSMIFLMLILGVACIFSSGVMAHAYGTRHEQNDFYVSVIGFCVGVFILISMIGAI